MNRNDIIKLAGEAGFSNNDGIVMGGASDLERFAALVAAEVGIAQYRRGYEEGKERHDDSRAES